MKIIKLQSKGKRRGGGGGSTAGGSSMSQSMSGAPGTL